MQKKVSISGRSYEVEWPIECPICHRNNEIAIINGAEVSNGGNVEIVFQCALENCHHYFIGKYGPTGCSNLLRLTPSAPRHDLFPNAIMKISPKFIEIYGQAEQARLDDLNQVAGPGFRKAVEFLIKDYTKSIGHRTDRIQIEKAFLGEVINKFVKDARIQAIAKRTLWVGNDETHYLKQWYNQDIDDFLILIKLTVHWIEMDLLSNQYVKKMPSKSRKKKL